MSTEVWLDDFEVEDEHRGGAKIVRHPVVRIIFLVDLVLRIIALYVAWRAHHRKWFVALLVVNSAGILPAAYLLRFRPRRARRVIAGPSCSANARPSSVSRVAGSCIFEDRVSPRGCR